MPATTATRFHTHAQTPLNALAPMVVNVCRVALLINMRGLNTLALSLRASWLSALRFMALACSNRHCLCPWGSLDALRCSPDARR